MRIYRRYSLIGTSLPPLHIIMGGDSVQDSGDREREQANLDPNPDLTLNPETSLIRTYRGGKETNNPSKIRDTIKISPERKGRITRNGIKNKELVPVPQMKINPGNSNPGTNTSKLPQGNRAQDPRNSHPGTSLGTSQDMINNNSILDLLGNHTGTSSSPGRVTKETLEKGEETGETQVKNMTIGTHRRVTTLGTM